MPSTRTLPAWLIALAAQLTGWALALLLARLGWLASLPLLLGLQALAAIGVSILLGAERWWILIHALFSPLLLAALALRPDPLWSAAALALLLLVFWGSPGSRVPLYLSGRKTIAALDTLLPQDHPFHLLDLGCGIGSVLLPLARKHPRARLHGVESAPALFCFARLRSLRHANVSVRRGNFMHASWQDYDVVYAFLSPHPMQEVWQKARRELRPGALLVSKNFPVPQVAPSREITLPRGGTLYCYQPNTPD